MLFRPTRIRAKFVQFHISAHGYTKNAPDFTLPNRDIPKTCPILDPNLWRGTFRGVCNTPLHGYTQKIVWFHIPARVPTKNAPDFTLPNKDTPKTCPVLHPNCRRGSFRGVCFCTLHGYMKNLAGFGLRHATWRETRRVLDFATRHGAKPGRFWTLPLDMARNPAGFGLCHTTWRETRRVLDFATRHGAKPGGFLTLPHDIAQNPAGF